VDAEIAPDVPATIETRMTTIPSTTWRTLSSRAPTQKDIPQGIDALWDRVAGMCMRAVPRRKRCLRQADQVLALEKEFTDLAEARLKETLQDYWRVFRLGKDTQADRIRALAAVREAAFRTLGMKPFRVQVAGAIALLDGCIAEMATGEGKSLTATMPAVLVGWRGLGCHVITVNDYLAQRDAEDFSSLYRFCGLTVRHINGDMQPAERKAGYDADITYLTNKEVSADFLRDRLALGKTRDCVTALLTKITEDQPTGGVDRLVQRGLHFAIIDEADSVLIDEAVTPLIISGEGPNPEQTETFKQAAEMASRFTLGQDYRVNERYKEITLTGTGRRKLREIASQLGGVWAGERRSEELLHQGLEAQHFYLRNKQYVVQEDKVVIVDESTGRLMPDREWRDGMHQAVSAKERLEIEAPKDTYARISFQRFFRLYRNLSGMTGTAAEARMEFWQIYHRQIVEIPTNRPCIRNYWPDRIFATEDDKWTAVVEEIQRVHQTGRPILVGTRSVGASEELSSRLEVVGLQHQVLNAIRHKAEAAIIAQAGQEGRITVATNMAGRGTDIKLGSGVAELGGLHVIATERHDSPRVDRQLFGRASRQGDPGSCQAFMSLDDELLVRNRPALRKIFKARYKLRRGDIKSKAVRSAFRSAQRRAQSGALTQRKNVLRTDDWLDEFLGFAGAEG
jgi:preprotein translocase subunit SecA